MTVLLAMLIDRWLGEPAARCHPVVWIGDYLHRVGVALPTLTPSRSFLLGGFYWVLGAAVVGDKELSRGQPDAGWPGCADRVLRGMQYRHRLESNRQWSTAHFSCRRHVQWLHLNR